MTNVFGDFSDAFNDHVLDAERHTPGEGEIVVPGGVIAATSVVFTPTGMMAATNVQAAIEELANGVLLLGIDGGGASENYLATIDGGGA